MDTQEAIQDLIERACKRKTTFGAWKTARRCADRWYGQYPYRCPFCSEYHIAHRLTIQTLELTALAIRVKKYPELLGEEK